MKTLTVVVPKPAGAYGVPQLGNMANQLFYEVSEGTCQVPEDELQRFLYVVQGARVLEDAVAVEPESEPAIDETPKPKPAAKKKA